MDDAIVGRGRTKAQIQIVQQVVVDVEVGRA
jgi:hypothetical protein